MSGLKQYPEKVGIVGFKDGTYDCYPNDADIPPSVKYIRYDIVEQELVDALDQAVYVIKEFLKGEEYFCDDIAYNHYKDISKTLKKYRTVSKWSEHDE